MDYSIKILERELEMEEEWVKMTSDNDSLKKKYKNLSIKEGNEAIQDLKETIALLRKLKDKKCLLTGAATGIGRALAFELAKEGVQLFLADIQIEELEKVKAELEPYGVKVFTGKCDVSNYEEFRELAEEVYSKFGGELDILINNAGIAGGGYCEDIPIEEWKRVIDVNLWSIIYATKIFVPKFLDDSCPSALGRKGRFFACAENG